MLAHRSTQIGLASLSTIRPELKSTAKNMLQQHTQYGCLVHGQNHSCSSFTFTVVTPVHIGTHTLIGAFSNHSLHSTRHHCFWRHHFSQGTSCTNFSSTIVCTARRELEPLLGQRHCFSNEALDKRTSYRREPFGLITDGGNRKGKRTSTLGRLNKLPKPKNTTQIQTRAPERGRGYPYQSNQTPTPTPNPRYYFSKPLLVAILEPQCICVKKRRSLWYLFP